MPRRSAEAGMHEGVLSAIGATPTVELSTLASPEGGRLVVKLEGGNPTGSMKDRMALAMVQAARRDGRLAPDQRVVELTGGSTGSSLGLVCAAMGHPLSIVTADCFAEEKIATMRAFGADVEVLETPEGKVDPSLIGRMQAAVREVVEETGAYWTRQHENPDQMEGYRPLAEELLEQVPDVTDLVMAVGTGGCAMGAARGFQDHEAEVRITVVEPVEAPYLSKGHGGAHDIEGIAVLEDPPLVDEALFDDVLAVPQAEAFEMARRAAREAGLFAGKSTGLNLAAARRVAKARGPDATVATVAVDTGLKYLAGGLFNPADQA